MYSGDDLKVLQVEAWEKDHLTTLNIVRGILRHPAYTLDNIAFAYNIARWSRILN